MAESAFSKLRRKQSTYIKIYVALCVIVLASMSIYTFLKYKEYSLLRNAVKSNNELIEILRTRVTDEKAKFEDEKIIFNNLSKDIDQKMSYIFPETDDYTSLTRYFDTVEEDLNRRNNPFEISNIDYQTIVEDNNFSYIPVKMNIVSSDDNFNKFLHLIETSGSLSAQIRLMDISSIRLNFEESDTEQGIISFTVQINAYFQK